MQPSTASIRDAVSAEEVCPLCLDHYTAADECTCVACRAPSCPSCAETIDADGSMRCFACRPPLVVQLPTRAAARSPLSLPKPIALPLVARDADGKVQSFGLPPLPFPLTTSPHGARSIKPRPMGSVYIGLPPVPPSLSASLRARPAAEPSAQVSRPSMLSLAELSARVRKLSPRVGRLSRRLHKLQPRLAQWAREVRKWGPALQKLSLRMSSKLSPHVARLKPQYARWSKLAAAATRTGRERALARLTAHRQRLVARLPSYQEALRRLRPEVARMWGATWPRLQQRLGAQLQLRLSGWTRLLARDKSALSAPAERPSSVSL